MRIYSIRDGLVCERPDLTGLSCVNEAHFYRHFQEVVKCTMCIVAFSKTLDKIQISSPGLLKAWEEACKVMLDYRKNIIDIYATSAKSRIKGSSTPTTSIAKLSDLLDSMLEKFDKLAGDWDKPQTSINMSVRTPWEALCRVLFLAQEETNDLPTIFSHLKQNWEPGLSTLRSDMERLEIIDGTSAKTLGSGQPRMMHVKSTKVEKKSVLITGFSGDRWHRSNKILNRWARHKRTYLLEGTAISDIRGRWSNAIRYLDQEQERLLSPEEKIGARRRVILRCREEHGRDQEGPSSAAIDFPDCELRNRCTVCLATNIFQTIEEPSLESCLELEVKKEKRIGSNVSCAEVETEAAQAVLAGKKDLSP